MVKKAAIKNMQIKKPWERRLGDLSHILRNCSTTYFDPDLFRMNTNQFLQTSRTVTFIIQKNKEKIPNFEGWYISNVLDPWKNNEVMQWAKNSRNKIEKEGDLEILSSLKSTLLFSYLEEQDIEIECGKKELIDYGIKKLVRFAQKSLPSGVSDAAAVKIERNWVTTSLSSWELLHALSYVYARIYECCKLLGQHLDSPLDMNIPNAGDLDLSREHVKRVQYVKLRGLESHHITSEIVHIDKKFEPPEKIQKVISATKQNSAPLSNLKETIDFYSKMAGATFIDYGNHVPMLFLFNNRWEILEMVTTVFEDQADKYIFWRTMAERVATLNVFAFVWISEAWIRKANKHPHIPIRNMPIVGEKLQVLGVDRNNIRETVAWNIIRSDSTKKPELTVVDSKESDYDIEVPYFFVPVLRKMGLSEKEIFPHGKHS